MREIKFRGQSVKDNNWWTGYYYKTDGKHYIIPFHNGIQPIEIFAVSRSQYTNNEDCNQRSIYENDKAICRVIKNGKIVNTYQGVIIWGRVSWCLQFKSLNDNVLLKRLSDFQEIEICL